MAFNDATCPRCGRKIRWTGDLKDRPACPGCGHQISQKDADEVEEKLAKARRELLGDDYDKE
jgi:uncharacterized protein (DUF983 family)